MRSHVLLVGYLTLLWLIGTVPIANALLSSLWDKNNRHRMVLNPVAVAATTSSSSMRSSCSYNNKLKPFLQHRGGIGSSSSSSSSTGLQASKVAPTRTASSATTTTATDDQTAGHNKSNKLLVKKVAVVGATGRTGRWVVQELLNRGAEKVVGLVRSKDKAQSVFFASSVTLANGKGSGNNTSQEETDVSVTTTTGASSQTLRLDKNIIKNGQLQLVECDLTNEKSVAKALKGIDAAIWCATGFSSDQGDGLVDKVRSLIGIVTKQSIDLVGLPKVAQALRDNNIDNNNGALPQIVMCSSAGVTRPTWDDKKKEQLVGAADIPIVRLNPFGILDAQRQSEQVLRDMKVPYCILRPGGLNDSWPAGSRPILSQGDVAVGRINRQDVASLLVDLLSEPDATGKTLEVIGLANYPKPAPSALTKSLQGLVLDQDGPLPLETVTATYAILQQLLPGEQQDSAALAMGQTYEQYDKGQTGRLGARGQENALAAAPQPTTSSTR